VVLTVIFWPHRNESAPQRIVIVNGSEIKTTDGNIASRVERLPANEAKSDPVMTQQSTKDAARAASPSSGEKTHEETKNKEAKGHR
jgi:hypothetical protein